MSDPFVAEIRIFACNFPPYGWAFCDGQILPISQNTALFSLLGTFYGGDGKSTFGLPNLQGAAPIHQGQGPGLTQRDIGEIGGVTRVTLLQSEIPVHSHTLTGTTDPVSLSSPFPENAVPATADRAAYQTSPAPLTALAPQALASAGGSQPHNNLQPYLTLNFCIALQGIYPSRS
jgi:microcystin-dependent protein